VRYDFLDFSTLEARRRDSEAEVRLNRRLARDVYLGTIPASTLIWMRYGVDQARRGWLEAGDVLNTRSWRDLKKLLRRT
jgi:aminoglycoside phosphotransferase family enzyme